MNIKLLEHQFDFLNSQKKICLLAGGIGSGKSYAGSYYIINKVIEDGKGKGFIGANTYKQLTNSTLACLFKELERLKIPFYYKENKGHLVVGGNKIICQSMENYEMLRGMELSYFWIDEVRDMKEEAFKILLGRLRDSRSKLEGRLTTSPCGYNWLYDYFVGDKKTKDFELIRARTYDNPYLPDDYIDLLRETYDSLMFQQEVEGEFINISTNRVYYAFSRDKNVQIVNDNPTLPLWVGMDFNINPMTACLCNIMPDNTIKIFDEIYMMTSNTNEIAQILKRRFPNRIINICPDATGSARKTSSEHSDHQILRSYGFNVHTRKINPYHIDRINTVNNLLDKNKILIDNRCRHLIKDLEQVAYKGGANIIDKSNLDLTHLSDGLGYLCFWHFGVKRGEVRLSHYI